MNKYVLRIIIVFLDCMFSEIVIEFGLEHDHDELTRLTIN